MSNAIDPGKDEARQRRLEQLLAMSTRIGDAIAVDIAALEKGQFADLRTADPDIEKLLAIYGREVKSLKADGGIGNASPDIVALQPLQPDQLGVAARHERLVTCMRQASEGLVKAVAEEVQKTRERGAPYAPARKPQHKPGEAIVYNRVV